MPTTDELTKRWGDKIGGSVRRDLTNKGEKLGPSRPIGPPPPSWSSQWYGLKPVVQPFIDHPGRWAGATIGGILGTPADVIWGPGGTIGGSALGAVAGQSVEDIVKTTLGFESAPKSNEEQLQNYLDAAIEGGVGGATALGLGSLATRYATERGIVPALRSYITSQPRLGVPPTAPAPVKDWETNLGSQRAAAATQEQIQAAPEQLIPPKEVLSPKEFRHDAAVRGAAQTRQEEIRLRTERGQVQTPRDQSAITRARRVGRLFGPRSQDPAGTMPPASETPTEALQRQALSRRNIVGQQRQAETSAKYKEFEKNLEGRDEEVITGWERPVDMDGNPTQPAIGEALTEHRATLNAPLYTDPPEALLEWAASGDESVLPTDTIGGAFRQLYHELSTKTSDLTNRAAALVEGWVKRRAYPEVLSDGPPSEPTFVLDWNGLKRDMSFLGELEREVTRSMRPSTQVHHIAAKIKAAMKTARNAKVATWGKGPSQQLAEAERLATSQHADLDAPFSRSTVRRVQTTEPAALARGPQAEATARAIEVNLGSEHKAEWYRGTWDRIVQESLDEFKRTGKPFAQILQNKWHSRVDVAIREKMLADPKIRAEVESIWGDNPPAPKPAPGRATYSQDLYQMAAKEPATTSFVNRFVYRAGASDRNTLANNLTQLQKENPKLIPQAMRAWFAENVKNVKVDALEELRTKAPEAYEIYWKHLSNEQRELVEQTFQLMIQESRKTPGTAKADGDQILAATARALGAAVGDKIMKTRNWKLRTVGTIARIVFRSVAKAETKGGAPKRPPIVRGTALAREVQPERKQEK